MPLLAASLSSVDLFEVEISQIHAKYDYVDSVNYANNKMAYKGKELEQLQASGTRVVVLENKHTSEDVAAARKSCHEPKSVEPTAKK